MGKGSRQDEALIGAKLGSIRITEKLGEGGMGAVYAGIDEKLQREVALKTIRSDRTNPTLKTRFLREARILSQLKHPNICSLYGLIEHDGIEYLVLEKLRGDQLRAVIKQRPDHQRILTIASQLASALAAAHSRGIVHRDLKPDNVMIEEGGVVKVLDFGLAQVRGGEGLETYAATHSNAGAFDERTTIPGVTSDSDSSSSRDEELSSGSTGDSENLTKVGSVMGTAAFMSPEQARGEPAVPASDIYSLGLILQRLWTGKSPYRKGLKSTALLLAAARADTLPVRGVRADVAELISAMKALAQEDRPSAAQVIERLRRIADRPRRRRNMAAALVALVLVAVAGVKYTFDVQRERDVALKALQAAEQSRLAAEQSRNESEEVVQFLVDLFRQSEPGEALGEDTTARELLDAGADRIHEDLGGQPLIQARLAETIGRVYNLLGLYEKAEALLTRSLEIRRSQLPATHQDIASSLDALGSCLRYQGRFEEAETYLAEAYAMCEQELGPEHEQTLQCLNSLGLLHWRQGRYKEAEAEHRRVLEARIRAYGPDDPKVATPYNNLGEVVREQGRLEEAAGYLEKALAIKRRRYGDLHPDVASTMTNLGQLKYQLDRLDEAEALFRGALEINEKILDPEHMRIAGNLNNLASVLDDRGKKAEAEAMFLRALEIMKSAAGPRHPRVAIALNNLGDLNFRWGRDKIAMDYFEKSLTLFRESLGPDHPYTAFPLSGMAQVADREGRLKEALDLMREVLSIREAKLADEHPTLIETREEVAKLERAVASSGTGN